MEESKQTVIRETVRHDGYPDSHEPMHNRDDTCFGCDEFKYRRNRNHRAGKTIGVAIRGAHPDEPIGSCSACKTPCYAANSGQAPAWAWNFNVDRAEWAVEPRGRNTTHPRSLCPRCRPKDA